jgi:hypothetical protein
MSIELVNYSPADDENKMTQVEPAEPVKPAKVDIILPTDSSDTSDFSHITLHQVLKRHSNIDHTTIFIPLLLLRHLCIRIL